MEAKRRDAGVPLLAENGTIESTQVVDFHDNSR
jgi:hypothetical protein